VKSRLPLYLDLIRWNRPAGWLLLLWPTLSALWIAAGGFPGWHLLVVFTLGTILMRSAGCCMNDVADRKFDRHVKRTAQRPVTRGAVSPREALAVGAVLTLFAFALVLTTTVAAVVWSFAALAVAVAYPYAKRFVSMPQAVLGVAFSFGIPMAFAAVRGGESLSFALSGSYFSFSAVLSAVPSQAWALLVGNLFWVMAYDTEYAMVDRDDDVHLGIHTSAITLGRWDVAAVLLFYLVYLGIWSWAVQPLTLPWAWWLGVAGAGAQVLWHFMLIRTRTRKGCFKAFRVNHWIGFSLFAGLTASV
jgi:4-hydroxybenzoate polyprenyltransferase